MLSNSLVLNLGKQIQALAFSLTREASNLKGFFATKSVNIGRRGQKHSFNIFLICDRLRILTVEFCSDFLNFHYKKSPNASTRSFNESGLGYCSCCTGLMSDLIISKSFLGSPAHSSTFPECSAFVSSMADLY